MEVLGWTPSGEYEEVDVYSMFRTPFEDMRDWHGEFKPYATPLNAVPGRYSPGFPSPSSSSAASSNYKATSQRRIRNPDHIPRPRNSFIIFRCDYTRKHCNGAGDHDSSDAEKRSLSKRAGEAWKNVSADVKKHYKRLADQEREEHARRNPDYRFRPRRRQPSTQGGRHTPPREKVKVAEDRAAENPRSRSSSFSSVESPQSNAGVVSSGYCQGSIPPTPPTSVSHLSSSSRQSSPGLQVFYPTASPEPPYTPLDSPTEHISYLAGSPGQDSLLFNSDTGINDPFFNYSDHSQFMLCGNLSKYAASDFCAPAKGNLPIEMTIPENESHVASSLAGWNGEEGMSNIVRSDSRAFSSPGGTLGYEYQHLSPEAYPTTDVYVTARDFSTVPSDIQNNLNAYALGLGDYGIGCDMSGFDFISS